MQAVRGFVFLCANSTATLAASCNSTQGPADTGERRAKTSSAVGAACSPPTTINTFVVYAVQSVTLGTSDHSVGGDVGVATISATNPQLTVGRHDDLDVLHKLVAPSVALGSGSVVGAVDTNSLKSAGGFLRAEGPYPSSMPPLPRLLSASPGSTTFTVTAGQQTTLSPGDYGTLTDNGTVFLNPGTYSFASVTLGNNAQLVAQQGGSTSIVVAGALATGTSAQIFPVGQPAKDLTISVSGIDGPRGQPTAVSLGANTKIVSLLAASNGSVSFGSDVQATGAFAGLNFTGGDNVVLNFQSGFPTEAPTISKFVVNGSGG